MRTALRHYAGPGCQKRFFVQTCQPAADITRRYQRSGTNETERQVIFSGIQPTGTLHLGNYLGALKPWLKLQNETPSNTKILYSVVDLHALTGNADKIRMRRRRMLALLLAIGLDPERCTIYFQSAVPAHTELMWILSCLASMGYLSRMTQWKSKFALSDDANPSEEVRARLRLGLFSYPVLQAADILVHRATHVPVGTDQAQHLEFSRECAKNFNSMYGKLFPIPRPDFALGRLVMSLKEPHRKMSKSHPDEKSRILLLDMPETIKSKIGLALTDSEPGVSYDPEGRPGVCNLLNIYSQVSGQQIVNFENWTLRQLKEHVADAVISTLAGIRDKYHRFLMADEGKYLDAVATTGADRANHSAKETMALVREAVGI